MLAPRRRPSAPELPLTQKQGLGMAASSPARKRLLCRKGGAGQTSLLHPPGLGCGGAASAASSPPTPRPSFRLCQGAAQGRTISPLYGKNMSFSCCGKARLAGPQGPGLQPCTVSGPSCPLVPSPEGRVANGAGGGAGKVSRFWGLRTPSFQVPVSSWQS